MKIEEIKEYLPHRYPFLLVDRVTELEIGESIAGYKNISANEHFFSGHFPNKPVMPGVLMVEALAQISGILGFKTVGKTPSDGAIYYLVGMSKTRFKKPVIPGDQLHLKASVLVGKRNLWKFQGTASVDGEIACETEIMLMERNDTSD